MLTTSSPVSFVRGGITVFKFLSLLVAVGAMMFAGLLASTPPQDEDEEPRKNSLRWHAKKAKEEGKDKVILASPHSDYPGAESPADELLTYSTIVIARPVMQRTYAHGDDEIGTWYKFRVSEVLSEKPPPCPSCHRLNPPPELLPLRDDEFLLAESGGAVTIDDVKVVMVNRAMPRFSGRKQYLLFISKGPKGVAYVLGGSGGVYRLDEAGTLEPFIRDDRRNSLRDALRDRFGNSVEALREHLRTN
jgi:hypothetical protein